MKKMRKLSLVKRIDAYLNGDLDEEESEQLWVELLQHPEYIDYLETEMAVRRIVASRGK